MGSHGASGAHRDRRRWAPIVRAMSGDALALRMGAIASDRGWGWPVLAAAVAFVGATVLALFHQQLDLSTYLLGGAHASSNDLFTVTYPTDHLGFTYPPFSALLFAPFAHLPLRACEVRLLLGQPGRALRDDRGQPARRVPRARQADRSCGGASPSCCRCCSSTRCARPSCSGRSTSFSPS